MNEDGKQAELRRISVDLERFVTSYCAPAGGESSSFADEVFGKLFVELGALHFMQAIDFVCVQDTVRALLDRAILQRSQDSP